jgi:hypothetical protein
MYACVCRRLPVTDRDRVDTGRGDGVVDDGRDRGEIRLEFSLTSLPFRDVGSHLSGGTGRDSRAIRETARKRRSAKEVDDETFGF